MTLEWQPHPRGDRRLGVEGALLRAGTPCRKPGTGSLVRSALELHLELSGQCTVVLGGRSLRRRF